MSELKHPVCAISKMPIFPGEKAICVILGLGEIDFFELEDQIPLSKITSLSMGLIELISGVELKDEEKLLFFCLDVFDRIDALIDLEMDEEDFESYSFDTERIDTRFVPAILKINMFADITKLDLFSKIDLEYFEFIKVMNSISSSRISKTLPFVERQGKKKKRKKKNQGNVGTKLGNTNLINLKEFSVDEIVPLLGSTHDLEIEIDGCFYKSRLNSVRLMAFKDSLVCSECGRVGVKFVLELPVNQNRPHFNLYDGENYLMTHDHIVPKSKGGNDNPVNIQTMCCLCNSKKGNYLDPCLVTPERLREDFVPPTG